MMFWIFWIIISSPPENVAREYEHIFRVSSSEQAPEGSVHSGDPKRSVIEEKEKSLTVLVRRGSAP
jgi:hypothetical protein